MTTTAPTPARATVFRGLPRVFWLLFSGQLVNRLGGVVLPFLAFHLAGRGYTAGQVAAVVSAYGLGGLGGQPLGGYLADRLGRRTTLIGGLLATAGCLVLIAAAGDLTGLTAAALAMGLAGDVYRPAASALVAETTPPHLRARAFGLMHWAVNAGAAVAGAVAGVLLAHGFWLLVALDVTTGVAFAVIVAVGIPRGRDRAVPRPARNGYAVAARDRLLLLALLLLLLGLILYAQAAYALPLALAADGLPASLHGLLITLNGAIVVIFQPVFIAWLSPLPRLPVLGVSMAVVGAGLALTGLAVHPWHYVVTVVLWSIGEIGMAGFEATLVADLTPEGAHGTYQALYGWTAAVARFAGPAAGAVLLQAHALWWACAATGALCAVFAYLLMPALDRRVRACGPPAVPDGGSAAG
ncbi:MFS transporter [Nonomuraea roseoviolacea]|uniref:MFS family permease n=1 Tax=Nonomuraea roseoviolacea subsp. carminata TaxID=160689 RepID=A0ABT1KDL9_9ACTN|nr:MFS transporter [Nonomuraea roseoviolacea]MCP2352060.1 MFS family permease [Nonomuraea roseoviolacea subsp. carminata]